MQLKSLGVAAATAALAAVSGGISAMPGAGTERRKAREQDLTRANRLYYVNAAPPGESRQVRRRRERFAAKRTAKSDPGHVRRPDVIKARLTRKERDPYYYT